MLTNKPDSHFATEKPKSGRKTTVATLALPITLKARTAVITKWRKHWNSFPLVLKICFSVSAIHSVKAYFSVFIAKRVFKSYQMKLYLL